MSKWNLISHLSERNRLLVLSVAVGIVVGLAAVVLKTLISLIQHGLGSVFGNIWNGALYYIVLPGIGMLLAMLLSVWAIISVVPPLRYTSAHAIPDPAAIAHPQKADSFPEYSLIYVQTR